MATQSGNVNNDAERFGFRWWQITPMVLLAAVASASTALSTTIPAAIGVFLGTMVAFLIVGSIGVFLYNVIAHSTTPNRTMTTRTWQLVTILTSTLSVVAIIIAPPSIGSVVVGYFVVLFLMISLFTYTGKIAMKKISSA